MSSEKSLLHFDYDEVSEKVLIGQGGNRKIFKGKFNSEFVALKVMDYIDEEDIKKEAKFLAKSRMFYLTLSSTDICSIILTLLLIVVF